MGKFQQARKKVTEMMKEWSGEERLWIHVYGENGCGKKLFIQSLLSEPFAGLAVVVNCDFSIFPLRQWVHLQNLIRQVVRDHPAEFQSFLDTLPRKWAFLIERRLSESGGPVPGAERERVGDQWELNVFSEFLRFLAQKQPLLLVMRGFFEPFTESSRLLLGVLNYCRDLPLVVLSSGSKSTEVLFPEVTVENIFINKRSVRETERIVAAHLRTEPMSSRLITNQLYIKSGGHFQKILFMLEAYYRPLLKKKQRKRSIDPEALQTVRPAARMEAIFEHLTATLPDAAVDLLAFLSRLDDPLPAALFRQWAQKKGLGKRNYQMWVQSGILREESYHKTPYVLIAWEPWKRYLHQHTSVERARWILDELKKQLPSLDFAWPVELSSQFLDTGDFSTALQLAQSEAATFARCGELRRALERYAFLRRNFARLPAAETLRQQILREMGETQMQAGLYENAFESFRELRDHLQRGQRREWVTVCLKMADALFQMDALSEAHYIVKDLKIKKDVPVDVQVFSNLLSGELENNFGHPQYALKYFRKALELLPGVRDEALIMRLYRIIKATFQAQGRMDELPEIAGQIWQILPPDSPNHARIRFDFVRGLIARHDYQGALPHIVQLYRRSHCFRTPREIVEVRLYLADAYAFLGKWHLSRSHLRKLLDLPVLLSNARICADVQTRLGIVEKEMGHYGAAIELLQMALHTCRQWRLTPQSYQVKVHLGHLYLLVGGFVRARDYLMSALEWAETHQNDEIALSATLFMASYGLQQNQLATAERYLDRAREILKMMDSPFDELNYLYYRAIYELKTGRPAEAEKTVQSWQAMANGMVKFESLARLLMGKVMMHQGRLGQARRYLEAALTHPRRSRLPHFRFQIYRDLAALAKQEEDTARFRQYNQQARQAFEELLEGVGDEILRRQIEESREYDELRQLSG